MTPEQIKILVDQEKELTWSYEYHKEQVQKYRVQLAALRATLSFFNDSENV